MDTNCIIPVPISFNCWKHHAGFIRKQISVCKNEKNLETLRNVLLKIGESQMDLYTGSYMPDFISRHIINSLKSLDVLSAEKYNDWLRVEGKDYRLFKLLDSSIWTLRLGTIPARYVHIHPGRNSPNTVRVRALTLKTAIFVRCWEKINNDQRVNVELINAIREKYLKEPPLKSISKESGLGKILELFGEIV